MLKSTLIDYLDTYLQTSAIQDSYFTNGLQVDSDAKEIKKIGYAVDYTTYIVDKGIKENVDMIIVHHGLHLNEKENMVGAAFQRMKRLIKNNICLYGSHLPLDAHPEVGNNIQIAKAFIKFFKLSTYKQEDMFMYGGKTIGFGLRFAKPLAIKELERFCKHRGFENHVHNYTKLQNFSSIAICSGCAGDELEIAHKAGYDIFLTGEAHSRDLKLAKEIGQSILVGGHYETETLGVQALACHLEKKFKIKTVFLDEKY